MMCYGDRAWCFSPNCTGKCGRQLTDHHRKEAERLGLLISGRYFCDVPEKTLEYKNELK